MSEPFPKDAVRRAITDSIPKEFAQYGADKVEPKFITCPASHLRALDPDCVIVEGIRGAGKSLWWTALKSPNVRAVLSEVFPPLRARSGLEFSCGFGAGSSPDEWPDKDILAALRQEHAEPRHIWRTVVGHHVFFDKIPGDDWAKRTRWTAQHPEDFAKRLASSDRLLATENKTRLILFDALDHTAENWPELRQLVRALLQVALDARSLSSVRLKIFLRPDMLEDSQIIDFPDSSKLLGSRERLSWRQVDLYSLLWQRLGNARQGGQEFRDACKKQGLEWQDRAGVCVPPAELQSDEARQRPIFYAIAGEFMGKDKQKGRTYSWLPSHLADGRKEVSPRSFLAAIRAASDHPSPAEWLFALNRAGLREGVRNASRIRVDEICEDYPWVRTLMEPLASVITVPCPLSDFVQQWKQKDVLPRLDETLARQRGLQPAGRAREYEGLADDLVALGVFERLRDGRMQMPDAYRIAFKFSRRGGVPPIK
ncbi:MAG: hypothetical protein ACLQVX_06750 [Limisphaerales bacterium]